MSALMRTPRIGSRRLVAVIGLLAILMVGLAACRGFFGQAPIAILWIDGGGDTEAPVTITFDISDSNDPDGTIASFDLDFGDGSTHASGADVSVPIVHEYTDEGTYQVVLTVTDNDGRIGMTNRTVTIGPVMITFATDRALGDYDIYRMKADGTDEAAVYDSADDELFPDLVRVTRDRIAFAGEDGTSWNIWTMTVDGTGRSQLTVQTASNQIQPSWSSDADMIAYASNAAQTPSTTTWEIYTMAADGTSQTKLTSQSPYWAIAPAYSPVSDDLVFVSDKGSTGGSSIWLREEDGTTTEIYDPGVGGRAGDASPVLAGLGTALDLPAGAGISRPVWSPDGTKIAFSRQRSTGEIDIYVMDSDGTNAETLEDYVDSLGSTNPNITTDYDEYCPYWLEDDSGIVFVRDDGAGDVQIYKVEFATGSVTQLTETGSNISPASKD